MAILNTYLHNLRKTLRAPARHLLVCLVCAFALLAILASANDSYAQDTSAHTPDYSKGVGWFPLTLKPFKERAIPGTPLQNGPSLTGLISGGNLPLSISQLDGAVVDNNLTVGGARFTVFMADADLLKARAGQAALGTSATSIPVALGSPAFGLGLFSTANTRARAQNIAPMGTLDPVLRFGFSVDQTTLTSNNTRTNGVATVSTHATSFQSAYVQSLPTGTSFAVGYSILRSTTTSSRARFNPSLSSNYTFFLNQNLFAGFGSNTRRFIKIADTNREASRQYFAQQIITQIVSAEDQYWTLVAAREQVVSTQQALTVSQQLLSDNRKQAEIGTMAPLDIVSAESEVAGRQRDLIAAQTAAQIAELKLKNMIARQLDEDLASVSVQTSDSIPEPKDGDQPAYEEAVAVALRNRPEVLQAQDGIRNQDIAVQYTRDALKPTMSIFGLYTNAGREATLGNALSEVWDREFPEYAFGFSLSFSLRNRSAQSDHAEALLRRQQSDVSLQRTEESVRLDVRNALIGIAQARARLAAARSAVDFNQQTEAAEEKKLRAGTSTSYNVILTQRDLLSAQLAEVQAHVAYAEALVELDRSMGTLLENRHIDLDQTISSSTASNSKPEPATP